MKYPKFRISYPMSAAQATMYARRMIAREMRGPNDAGEAMNRLEAKYGLPFWSLEHLRKGKAKTCDVGLFSRLRTAYLDHCERQLKALEHELSIERAAGNDDDADILAEVETLLAKVAERKGR